MVPSSNRRLPSRSFLAPNASSWMVLGGESGSSFTYSRYTLYWTTSFPATASYTRCSNMLISGVFVGFWEIVNRLSS